MSGKYEGLDNDKQFGMSPVGRLIRDAWVFGLLPDTEQCAGWSAGMLQYLYEKVHTEWMKYGHLPSRLPPELQQRHTTYIVVRLVRRKPRVGMRSWVRAIKYFFG